MDTGTADSSGSSSTDDLRWKRWKVFALVVSFTLVRLFLVGRYNSAKVAFVEAYEAKDAGAAWQALDLAERGTWSEGSSSLRSMPMPGIPSWAVRRERWLGFGDTEWTLAERTFFGGSTEVVYRVSGGRAIEQPSGN